MKRTLRFYLPEIAVFAGLAGLKAGLLVTFGPAFLPDSGGYINFAGQIISGAAWKPDATMLADPIIVTRMIGYPAIIALCMAVAGHAWPYLLIALQSGASLIAALFVYALSRQLGLSRAVALFAVTAFATSTQLTLDQCILTDSLNASMIIIGTCILTFGASTGRPLRLQQAFAGGLCFAEAMLIREAMQVLFVTLLPLLGVRWLLAKRTLAQFLYAAFVLVPLVVAIAGYMSWNQYRYGHSFITVGTGAPMLLSLTYAAAYDPTFFAGDSPLRTAARRLPNREPNAYMQQIQQQLEKEGYSATDIVHMIRTEYLQSWRSHAAAMLHVMRNQFSENLLKLAFRPLSSACVTAAWSSGQEQCPDYRDEIRSIRRGSWHASIGTIVYFVATTVERTVSIVLTLNFAIGTPLVVLLAWQAQTLGLRPIALTAASLWAMYLGWMSAFAFFQLDTRYLAPVNQIPIAVGLSVLVLSTARFRRPRKGHETTLQSDAQVYVTDFTPRY